jgi:hypothetical protein
VPLIPALVATMPPSTNDDSHVFPHHCRGGRRVNSLDISQKIVAATLMFSNGEALTPFVQRVQDSAPDAFDDLRYGSVVRAIRELRSKGKLVHQQSILESVQFPDAGQVIGELTGADMSMEVAEIEAERIWNGYLPRRMAALLDESQKALLSSPRLAASIAGHLHVALDSLHREADPLSSRLKDRLFNIKVRPAEPIPRYLIGSIPICTPGNLTTVSAVPKAGKTAWIGAMMAAVMTQRQPTADCLGLLSRNPEGHALIHLDSEQSLFDAFMVISTALRRAGLSEPPPWLRSYCITGLSISEARECIHLAMEQAAKEHGGVHSVLLDGSADFVQDVNDPGESSLFVNELHGLAIKFHCPITSVIHLNPGTEKTRGHLGSQLERKSETNLRLERDGDSIVVWADKNRRAPITKDQGPRFQWSNELKMHVSIESAGDAKAQAKRQEQQEHAEAVFDSAKQSSLSWSVLVENYGQTVLKSSRKERTARRHVDEMIRAGILRKNLIGHYELA